MLLAFKWNLRIHDLKGTQEKALLAEGMAGAKAVGWEQTRHVWESECRVMFLGHIERGRERRRSVKLGRRAGGGDDFDHTKRF